MKGNKQKFLTGGFRELLILFLPILLMTFSNGIYLLVEKLLLARLSAQAMEAAVNAAFASQIAVIPCVSLAMMLQVCVGRWQGAREFKFVGPGTWQFIWFSILSLVITVPVSIVYGHYFFSGTALETIVYPYYYILIFINFLYPLSTTLTCFYLGQGKTSLVLFSTMASQILKLGLAYLLIFGLDGILPAMGLIGGAVSTVIAQGLFCAILLGVFLNSKHRKLFNTPDWKFRPKFFWECINPGILRAFNRILNVASWTSIVHLMTIRGGDYLLALSIGGTLFLFLPFIGDAICQAQTTIVSNILGSKIYHRLTDAFRSGMILVSIAIFVTAIPLVVFPVQTFEYLFPALSLNVVSIERTFYGIWLSFAFFTFSYIPISYVLAFKDTKFSMFMGFINWINGYLFMFIAIEKFQIGADQFWLTLSFMHLTTAMMYYWRMKWLQARLAQPSHATLVPNRETL